MPGTILVIAGLLSVTAIALGLFKLLSKSHAGEAEGEWPGKVKVKGPVGLFIFCVGAVLLVITMRQITTSLARGRWRPAADFRDNHAARGR